MAIWTVLLAFAFSLTLGSTSKIAGILDLALLLAVIVLQLVLVHRRMDAIPVTSSDRIEPPRAK